MQEIYQRRKNLFNKGMKIELAGIRRGNQYSPNHIGNDAAIFQLTIDELRKLDCEVIEFTEKEFQDVEQIEADFVFNMARDTKTIQKLQKIESEGKKVINSGFGIENCTREKMTRLIQENHIPHPRSIIITTDALLPDTTYELGTHCWIKRGDFHAMHREDVTHARIGDEAQEILREYALRGIPTAVINEHLSGDLIKFYGVEGTDFFHWFYPNDLNHSKFGLEKINGKAKGIPFDLNGLKAICSQTAKILDIYIYGGDCIIDFDGTIRLIDFNDWPSFAPCRSTAAPYIAKCIYEFTR